MRHPWWVQIEELEQSLGRKLFESKKAAKAFCERWVGRCETQSALLYSREKKSFVARCACQGARRWEPAGGTAGQPRVGPWPGRAPSTPAAVAKTVPDA